MTERDASLVIASVCDAIARGEPDGGRHRAARVPRRGAWAPRRAISQQTATRVYLRDGFVDRYTGARLVFPGVLLLLTRLLAAEFSGRPELAARE